MPFLLSAIAIMLCLGAVAAVLFRVGGLVVLMLAFVAILLFRWLAGYAFAGWGVTLLLFAALQAGYLAAALSPLSDLVRKAPPGKAPPGKAPPGPERRGEGRKDTD